MLMIYIANIVFIKLINCILRGAYFKENLSVSTAFASHIVLLS